MKEKIAVTVASAIIIAAILASAVAISDVKILKVRHENVQKQVTDNKDDVEKNFDKIDKKLDWMVRNWPKR